MNIFLFCLTRRRDVHLEEIKSGIQGHFKVKKLHLANSEEK